MRKRSDGNKVQRIGLVMQSLRTGGLEALVMRLARAWKARGWEPEVIAYEAGELHEQLLDSGIAVHLLPKSDGYKPSFSVDLMSLFGARRYDVVHTHHFGPLLYAAPGAMRHGIPLVHTVHSNEHLGPSSQRHRMMFRAFAMCCSAITTVSEELSTFLVDSLSIPRALLHPLANGVDSDAFHPHYDVSQIRRELAISQDTPLLGCVARLEPEKGHTHLLDAMASLSHKAHLLLVGEGSQRGPLTQQARALGLLERVHFVGNRTDVPALLCAMDLFVLPSLREGLPLALLEAMSARRPVVSSAVGGTPALLRACDGGRLVPPGDAKALSNEIDELLAFPMQRKEMAARGQAWVHEKYSQAQMLLKYKAIYERAEPVRPMQSTRRLCLGLMRGGLRHWTLTPSMTREN